MQSNSKSSDITLNQALLIIDAAWNELQRSPFVQLRCGRVPTRLPDVSFAEAERRSSVGQMILKRLEALDFSILPHDVVLTLRLVRFRAHTWSREADWYWLMIDPRGIGSFGAFLPTAYCGVYLLNFVHHQLASFQFRQLGDSDRYLGLVADYARLVDQFSERTAGQAERGIYIPRAQIEQARSLLIELRRGAQSTLSVAPERVARVPASGFLGALERRIATDVEPAFDRALEGLSQEYYAKASEEVGIGQYPGGPEIYSELVRLYTTVELTPEQVHARGHDRLTQIEAQMDEVRMQCGFRGDSKAFLNHLKQEPRWRADTVDGVAAVFGRYLDRLRPRLNDYFRNLPVAPCGVAPVPEAVQGAMTFGYYDPPRKDRPDGRYLFNTRNLSQQPLFHLAALTYHELMPGHHLQLALQHENENTHPFRTHSFVTAYIEGWAEYAATFAGEIGMYELPEERYGRLVMDAFLTCRLVVDTGMNVFGWSLERAREYLRAHTAMPEREVLTESIRYSCDYIGQGLAYKLGDTRILAMRDRMRTALGDNFDIRDFHEAVLGPGALPFPDLEWHLDHKICELKLARSID